MTAARGAAALKPRVFARFYALALTTERVRGPARDDAVTTGSRRAYRWRRAYRKLL